MECEIFVNKKQPRGTTKHVITDGWGGKEVK
jgi:hypothetical protein